MDPTSPKGGILAFTQKTKKMCPCFIIAQKLLLVRMWVCVYLANAWVNLPLLQKNVIVNFTFYYKVGCRKLIGNIKIYFC